MNIALGNGGINFLDGFLVSCQNSFLVALFQSFIKLFSSSFHRGNKSLVDLRFLLRNQHTLLCRLDIRQTIHLLDDT